jgi:hypothetical protein
MTLPVSDPHYQLGEWLDEDYPVPPLPPEGYRFYEPLPPAKVTVDWHKTLAIWAITAFVVTEAVIVGFIVT